MSETRLKAFEFASECAKQELALATGTVALTVTFATDIAGAGSMAATITLCLSWVLMLASVIAGLLCLQGLTESLRTAVDEKPEINTPAARAHAAQSILFLLGIILMVVFAGVAMWSASLLKDTEGGRACCPRACQERQPAECLR